MMCRAASSGTNHCSARPRRLRRIRTLASSSTLTGLCCSAFTDGPSRTHPSLMNPDDGIPGNGLLLFFRVDDYSAALRRARALVPQLAEEPHVNPNTRTKEFSLRDPDGYYVTISALSRTERAAVAKQRPNKRLQPTKARAGVRQSAAKRPRLRG